MKVIKHGKYYKKRNIKCKYCDCEFKYNIKEVSFYMALGYVICPECEMSIYFHDIDWDNELKKSKPYID